MFPMQENRVYHSHNSKVGKHPGPHDPKHCHFILTLNSKRKFYPLNSGFLLSGGASLRKEGTFHSSQVRGRITGVSEDCEAWQPQRKCPKIGAGPSHFEHVVSKWDILLALHGCQARSFPRADCSHLPGGRLFPPVSYLLLKQSCFSSPFVFFLPFRYAPPAVKEIFVICHSLEMKLMPHLPPHRP